MDWLCIHLSQLAVDSLRRNGVTAPVLAVLESRGAQRWIHAASQAAAKAGIRPTMNLGAAYALVPELTIRPRDRNSERQLLEQVALTAYGISDRVSIQLPDCVALEIGRSRRLLAGKNIRQPFLALGLRLAFASAPTPRAALLLARAGCYRGIRSLAELDSLPLARTELDAAVIETLHGAGIRTLADLRRLPRTGLIRRFGAEPLVYLDRLLGQAADPLTWFEPPNTFEAALDLPSETEDARALVFAASRLLEELERYLEIRGLATRQLDFQLAHSNGDSTGFTVGLLEPGKSRNRLLDLFRERINHTRLRAPVRRLVLKVADLCELAVRNADLFERSSRQDEHTWARLLERLRSRLGENAIHHLFLSPDHRPERAWHASRQSNVSGHSAHKVPLRPLWLLPKPEPLATADLALLDGPERIESGWWDDGDIARDYYIVRLGDGRKAWVFRECRGRRDWYLHGLFG
ncbi:MAG: DNA polymerase Y family protein [Xanthomonadales bacterium]|nr:DNA polymerase Y family protein [Xanthomonadales bacterium]